jgi:hypothetical protein
MFTFTYSTCALHVLYHALAPRPTRPLLDSAYRPREPYHPQGTSFRFPYIYPLFVAQLHPSKSFESLKNLQHRWKPSKLRLAVQKLPHDFGSYPSGAKRHFPIPCPRVCQPFTVRLFNLELRGFCYLIACYLCGGRVAGLVLIRMVCRDVEGEVLR